jgi:hypothetical protein
VCFSDIPSYPVQKGGLDLPRACELCGKFCACGIGHVPCVLVMAAIKAKHGVTYMLPQIHKLQTKYTCTKECNRTHEECPSPCVTFPVLYNTSGSGSTSDDFGLVAVLDPRRGGRVGVVVLRVVLAEVGLEVETGVVGMVVVPGLGADAVKAMGWSTHTVYRSVLQVRTRMDRLRIAASRHGRDASVVAAGHSPEHWCERIQAQAQARVPRASQERAKTRKQVPKLGPSLSLYACACACP